MGKDRKDGAVFFLTWSKPFYSNLWLQGAKAKEAACKIQPKKIQGHVSVLACVRVTGRRRTCVQTAPGSATEGAKGHVGFVLHQAGSLRTLKVIFSLYLRGNDSLGCGPVGISLTWNKKQPLTLG